MTDTYHLNIIFISTEHFTYRFCLKTDGAGRCFHNKQVTILTMLKSIKNKVNSLFKRHDKTSNIRLSNCDRITSFDLIDPKWNYRTTGTHNISITCTADLSLSGISGFGNSYRLFKRFRLTHSIDRICSLVCGKTDNRFNPFLNSCCKDIICSYDIGFHCFHREELARRHLFQRSSMKNVIYTMHSTLTRL